MTKDALTKIVHPMYETFSEVVNIKIGERKANFRKMELKNVDTHSHTCNNQLKPELGKRNK